MVTDTERREVARRLRELPGDSTYPDLIGAIADRDGWYPAADAADRLADLIDPDTTTDTTKSATDTTKCDRDALLKLAYVLQAMGERSDEKGRYDLGITFTSIADRIREALGLTDG